MKALRKIIAAAGAGSVAALTAVLAKFSSTAVATNPYGVVGGEVSLVNSGGSLVAALAAAGAIVLGIALALKYK